MKTFAQLKRDLKVNVAVKTLANTIKPDKNGQTRNIAIVQTNAIAFRDNTHHSGLSWLWWEKAGQYEYEGNTFKVYADTSKQRLLFAYEIIA